MTAPLLDLQNVTIELSGETILKDVTIAVNPGDTIVLVGPSGAGKSVLLKTMAGLYDPIAGRVLCHGTEWKNLSVEGRHDLARKVGMQFQKDALFDELTVFGNVEFVLKEHTTMTAAQIESRVMECLTAVGLEKVRDYQESELSGGMKHRLGVARSIALKPEILFMDDPTAGLDPINSDKMAEMILDLKKSIGATLVVVTHDISRAYQFAGRIFLVAGPEVLETGGAEETRNHPDPRVQQFIHGSLTGPLTGRRDL